LGLWCTYTVRYPSIHVDISNLSEVPEEKEVFILPFSAFRAWMKKNYDSEMSNVKILAELELEECEIDIDQGDPNKKEFTIIFE
jgi:hypothetical protein